MKIKIVRVLAYPVWWAVAAGYAIRDILSGERR